jgi:hypothetical protein
MMTEELLSYNSLPCVPLAVRDSDRYAKDHVIRYYRNQTLADLSRDLGHPLPDPFEIVGGIGVLTMTANGNVFAPAIPDKPPTAQSYVTPDIEAKRKTQCVTCQHYTPEHDRCGMCGCAGQVTDRVKRPWAACPRGYWGAEKFPLEPFGNSE